MRVATVNDNGLRAAMTKGMHAWLDARRPDFLLLQEVRADTATIEKVLGTDWDLASEVCRIRGRAGVVIASRTAPVAVRAGVPGEQSDVDSGRWVEADYVLPGRDAPLTLVSTYLHAGTANTPTMDLKYAHLDLVTARLTELAHDAAAGIRDVLVGGDFNIVRAPIDIRNFRSNHNRTAGVLDTEIAYFERWFGDLGWMDVHRTLEGERQGPYTWWSQRGKAFDNDVGWRLDYQIATPGLGAVAADAVVDRAAAWDKRFSDHAPLTIDYAI